MATTVNGHGPLAPPDQGAESDEFPDSAAEFALLDVYDERPASLGQARPDALATISAGERGPAQGDRPGPPKVSRDGTIVLHDPEGRAPGLKAALAATGNKRLTIAFPFSDLRLFWQERFSRYSATRLEVYGDQDELREIVVGPGGPEHVLHLAGSPEYERLRKTCKVSTSLYFALAQWEATTPRIVFPDGLALYRLRTTSRHSRRSMLGTLQTASRFTGGQLAGLPFDLTLTYREVPDPSGAKRNVPVWSLLFRPPQQIALSTATWGQLRDAALAEGRVLAAQPALQAPTAETWQIAQAEGDVVEEPSDADLAQLLEGDSPADAAFWRATWFGVTDHTILAQDHARHQFIERYTDGRTASLAEFLQTATNTDAERMVKAAVEMLTRASAVGAPTGEPGLDRANLDQRRPTARQAAERRDLAQADDFLPEPEPPEPTPLDDVLDEAPDFMPDEDDRPPAEQFDADGNPVNADVQEHVRQWLAEVARQITEAHTRGGQSAQAHAAMRRIVADLLLATVGGDLAQASRLLFALTGGGPNPTRTAKSLTVAQATVIQGIAARADWRTCAEAALAFGTDAR